MAAAAILHVGEDICRRIPVMEARGYLVHRSEPSVDCIRSAVAGGSSFSVITFHNDLVPPSPIAVSTARSLSSAPLILFENPSVDSDERIFDYIIPAQIPPFEWLRSIEEVIEKSVRLRELSEQLRTECVAVQGATRTLRKVVAQIQTNPFDSDAIWRGDADPESMRGGDAAPPGDGARC